MICFPTHKSGCPRSLALGDRGKLHPGFWGCPTLGVPADRSSSVGWTLGAPLFLRLGWAGFLPLLLAVAQPFFAPAQSTTLHVDVKLVSVFVNVTDRNGAIVGGLTRNDFALYEDGRPQQIAVFERQSEMPLDLTLAIDTSGSVRKDLGEETAAARRFVHAILRPQDQMSVMQFATNVQQLSSFTNKEAQIDHALGELHADWATALYDAIYQGSDALGTKQGRKVLVVVSDGDDTAQNTTYAQALEEALRNEVMIYTIIDVPIAASAGRDLGGEHALITLAEQTGGKYFYVDAGGLDKAFAQVSDDLRTQYLIGYYPHNQVPGTEFHRLNVTIPRAAPGDFNIRHKTGYYAEPVDNN
jgi:Ca-activated chloride channel homolog